MTNWAPITKTVIDKGFGQSRSGGINGIVIHHVAGTNGRDYVANWNSRDSHPTYHIANNGTVTGIVHPDREPDSTQGGIDDEAITVEIDNSSTGGNWPVSQAALNSLVKIIVYHESQSKRKGFALNKRGVGQSEFFIAWHQQYYETACPGPFVISKLPWILSEAKKAKAGSGTAGSKPTPIKGDEMPEFQKQDYKGNALKLKKGVFSMLPVTTTAATYDIARGKERGEVNLDVTLNGLPKGEQAQLRLAVYKNGKYSRSLGVVEFIGTDGGSFGQHVRHYDIKSGESVRAEIAVFVDNVSVSRISHTKLFWR